MTLRPCTAIRPDGKTCGATPALTESERYGINIMRLECQCGNRGATLMYSKPEDRARMKQAAEDGWNLAG
jgi:hypothetical protein